MAYVLVIEDEAALRKNIEQSLREAGFEVVTAADLVSARMAFEAVQIDTVCTDVNLPDGNGLDFLKEALSAHPRLRAIVMSASATTEDRLRAKGFGLLGFLDKPFRLADLVELVSKARQ